MWGRPSYASGVDRSQSLCRKSFPFSLSNVTRRFKLCTTQEFCLFARLFSRTGTKFVSACSFHSSPGTPSPRSCTGPLPLLEPRSWSVHSFYDRLSSEHTFMAAYFPEWSLFCLSLYTLHGMFSNTRWGKSSVPMRWQEQRPPTPELMWEPLSCPVPRV